MSYCTELTALAGGIYFCWLYLLTNNSSSDGSVEIYSVLIKTCYTTAPSHSQIIHIHSLICACVGGWFLKWHPLKSGEISANAAGLMFQSIHVQYEIRCKRYEILNICLYMFVLYCHFSVVNTPNYTFLCTLILNFFLHFKCLDFPIFISTFIV